MLDSLARSGESRQMREKWKVFEYLDDNGHSPLRKWLDSSGVSKFDSAKFWSAITNIKGLSDDLPPRMFQRYLSTEALSEMRVTGEGRKMLRPLGIRTGMREILVFTGAVEKDNKLDTREGEQLWRDWASKKGSKREL